MVKAYGNFYLSISIVQFFENMHIPFLKSRNFNMYDLVTYHNLIASTIRNPMSIKIEIRIYSSCIYETTFSGHMLTFATAKTIIALVRNLEYCITIAPT